MPPRALFASLVLALALAVGLGACVTIDGAACSCAAGTGGASASSSAGTGGAAPAGPRCADVLSCALTLEETSAYPAGDKYAALVECIHGSAGACTPVCGAQELAPGTCGLDVDSLGLACKVCVTNACTAQLTACTTDDGTPSPTPITSGDNPCSCPAGMPLCPGHSWGCDSPGDYTHQQTGDTCGTATYCAPCCDPTDECSVRGSCAITKISQVTCVENYECCSGICTGGLCDGGCGVILPGSGSSGSGSSGSGS